MTENKPIQTPIATSWTGPSKEWLEHYEKVREATRCLVDLNAYFEKSEIAGIAITQMEIGPCDLPSGKVLVRDPFVFLPDPDEKPYFQTVPAGSYSTEICVVRARDGDCNRYAAARVRFNDKRACSFYEALVGDENLEDLDPYATPEALAALQPKDAVFYGFGVDAGLACICDKTTHQEFVHWQKQLEAEDSDLYDAVVEDLLKESYQKHPEFQRGPYGDYAIVELPESKLHMPIFCSGFGDGGYPVYFGHDEQGQICQLVVLLINIEVEYNDEEEDDEDDAEE